MPVQKKNKWSELCNIRRYRHRTRKVQSYSPGDANVPPSNTCLPEFITQAASRSVQPLMTAHGKKSIYCTMCAPFAKNCPFYGGSGPHLIRDSFGQSENGTTFGSAVFCTDDRRVSLYFKWAAPSYSKSSLLMCI